MAGGPEKPRLEEGRILSGRILTKMEKKQRSSRDNSGQDNIWAAVSLDLTRVQERERDRESISGGEGLGAPGSVPLPEAHPGVCKQRGAIEDWGGQQRHDPDRLKEGCFGNEM